MAHDTHFLERLERMGPANVELALGLYRDRPLLQFILASVRLPDGAERVAISLDDPTMGPFIVVTRDGTFVTCLGDGMPVRELPVIARGQLDGLSAKVERLRQHVTEGMAAIGPDSSPDAALRPLVRDPFRTCREDMEAAVALRPLNHRLILRLWGRYSGASTEFRERLTPRLRSMQRRCGEAEESALRGFIAAVYATANLSVLVDNGPGFVEEFRRQTGQEEPLGTFSWGLTRSGLMGPALRGFWAMGAAGKPGLAYAKAAYNASLSRLQYLDTSLGLAVLGLRHKPIMAEVGKTLRNPPSAEGADQEGVQRFGQLLSNVFKISFETPDVAIKLHDAFIRTLVLDLCGRTDYEDPWTFRAAEEVPPELVHTWPLALPLSFLKKPDFLMTMGLGLPRLARARPEELYLPRSFTRMVPPLDPLVAIQALEGARDLYGEHVQVKRPPRPGRNDKCHCGSGKKYKRCCL